MTETIFKDNRIICTGDIYRFAHPYEINIVGAHVYCVDRSRRMIHFVITDSDTKSVLDDFVEEVARACGIDRHININNIVLPIPATMELTDVQSMTHCDILLEWRSFTIDHNIQLMHGGMTLTNITIHGTADLDGDRDLLTEPLGADAFSVSYKIESLY
jgi:hypothetical protein